MRPFVKMLWRLYRCGWFCDRFITISASGTTSSSNFLRTLRAVRVLRPLKLVSGVPSTSTKPATHWCIGVSAYRPLLAFKTPTNQWRPNFRYFCINSATFALFGNKHTAYDVSGIQMSAISYVLNADSGRYADTVICHIAHEYIVYTFWRPQFQHCCYSNLEFPPSSSPSLIVVWRIFLFTVLLILILFYSRFCFFLKTELLFLCYICWSDCFTDDSENFTVLYYIYIALHYRSCHFPSSLQDPLFPTGLLIH